MNKLEKIVISGMLGLSLVGCSNKEIPITLSNGLHAYGIVTTHKEDGHEFKSVYIKTGYGKKYNVAVYDYGNGKVVAKAMGKTYEGDDLTYEYCGQKFPIWEPTAFRETPCYTSMGRYSPYDTTSKD